MWLLETTTCQLEYFPNSSRVAYAILSHRWGDGEVQFSQMQPDGLPEAQPGWLKVKGACRQARKDGHSHIWIDTCGIDRSSSAELSEAINSMYRWYHEAAVCYAYLNDVKSEIAQDISNSEWFKRGWTLQELIAPLQVEFYNADWKMLGERYDLANLLNQITGIPRDLLVSPMSLNSYSIAQRMSWAAGRETTRPEDLAYSLMGIFGVNMPMLYGEGGERAFIRLQEAIIEDSDDHTIFAWKLRSQNHYWGLLAVTPAAFADCKRTVQVSNPDRTPFRKTNMGLQITLSVHQYALNVYHAALDCMEPTESDEDPVQIGIFLSFPHGAENALRPGRCVYQGIDRKRFATPALSTAWPRELSFIVPSNPFPTADRRLDKARYGFLVDKFEITLLSRESLSLSNGHVYGIARSGTWDAGRRTLTLEECTHGTAMGFALADRHRQPWMIARVGFDTHFAPWVWVASRDKIPAHLKDRWSEARALQAVPFRDLLFDQGVNNIDSLDWGMEGLVSTCESNGVGNFMFGDRFRGLQREIGHTNVTVSRRKDKSGDWTWALSIHIGSGGDGQSHPETRSSLRALRHAVTN